MTDQAHSFDAEREADLEDFLTVDAPAVTAPFNADDVAVEDEIDGGYAFSYIDDMVRNERDPSKFEGTALNLKLALENDPRTKGLVAYDEFSDRIVIKKPFRAEVRGVNDWGLKNPTGDALSQKHILTIQTFFQAKYRQVGADGGYKTNANKEIVKDALTGVAFNHTFDSLRDSLDILEWDGNARISSFFSDFFGTPRDAYHAEVARLFFVAAVTRAFEPGHKFDYILSLVGGQGVMKSTAVEKIGGIFYRAVTKNAVADPKKLVEQTMGSWIVELPENAALKKVSEADSKAIISATVDRDRMSYEKFAEDYARRWVMVITTNERKFLSDPTGNRRYWPVTVGVETIDVEAIGRIRDQLWAEAVQIYRQMRREKPEGWLYLCLPKHLEAVAGQKQEMARMGDDIEDILSSVRAYLETPKSDGDLEIDGEKYYAELDKAEIWHGITDGQGGEFHNASGARKINQALSMIDYVSVKPASMIKRLGKKANKIVIDPVLFRKALAAEEQAEVVSPARVEEEFVAVAPGVGVGEDGQGVGGREEKPADGMEMGGEAPAAADSFDDLDEQAPAEEPAPAPIAEVKVEVAAPVKSEPAPAPKVVDQLDDSPF